jgi:site-specific recombinase XerD
VSGTSRLPQLTRANAGLYREWQRARAGEGYAELPRHRLALASLQAAAGGRGLDELGRGDIRDWIAGLDWMAPSARLSYFSSARAFYNFAGAEEIIAKSPMTGLGQPKNPDRPVPIPLLETVRALIAACEADKTPIGLRDTAMVRIMCDTGGPRASEVAGMLIAGRPAPGDRLGLDLAHDVITVIGKGSKIRTWPIANRTARAASRWVRARDKLPESRHARLWLPFRGHGAAFTRSGVQQMLDRRCGQAGVPGVHPHQLRHFSYHNFLKAGGRLDDAKRLYGWEDDAMPAHYAAALADERAIEAGSALAIGDGW